MSQVIFTTATTKGEALTGINANFTEVYANTAAASAAAAAAAASAEAANSLAASALPTASNQWIPTNPGATAFSTQEKRSVLTSGGTATLTLPASPVNGDWFRVQDGDGAAATHNITIACNGNPIAGVTQDLVISTNNADCLLVYIGGEQGYQVTRYQ